MRVAHLILFLAVSFASSAQDREFPDYRSKKDNFARIQEKDIRGDVACFAFGGMDESIGKGKLPSVAATKYGNNYITFTGNNLQVTITGAF
jgi:hypothetical protein